MTHLARRVLSTVLLAVLAAVPATATSRDDAPAPSSITPAPRDHAGAIARQDECIRRVRESEPTRVIFVGDSITQGWEQAGREVWERSIAPLGALNLGNSGDRTEHVLWRLEQAPLTRLAPEHIVLLIGTNNLGHGSSNAQETLMGITAVARMLHEQCPDAHIHILEIFPRGETMNPMRGDICQINQALRAWVPAMNKAMTDLGTPARYHVNALGDRFVEADGRIPKAFMPDSLHLSPLGYQIWAEAIVPAIR
jgi:lysophospholipase L1-like esterase